MSRYPYKETYIFEFLKNFFSNELNLNIMMISYDTVFSSPTTNALKLYFWDMIFQSAFWWPINCIEGGMKK